MIRSKTPATTPASAIPASTSRAKLAALAKDIRDEHAAAVTAARQSAAHAMRAGDFLIEAKAAVQHGEWLPYIEDHVRMPERTAQFYMYCARNRPAIERLLQQGLEVTLRNVRKMIAPKAERPDRTPPVPHEGAERQNVVELLPPQKNAAEDAFSLSALPVAQEEQIDRGHAVLQRTSQAASLDARGAIEALTKELNGEPPDREPPDEEERRKSLNYLAAILLEPVRDDAAALRDLVADAASCAPAFHDPQQWLDVVRAYGDDADADPKSRS